MLPQPAAGTGARDRGGDNSARAVPGNGAEAGPAALTEPVPVS